MHHVDDRLFVITPASRGGEALKKQKTFSQQYHGGMHSDRDPDEPRRAGKKLRGRTRKKMAHAAETQREETQSSATQYQREDAKETEPAADAKVRTQEEVNLVEKAAMKRKRKKRYMFTDLPVDCFEVVRVASSFVASGGLTQSCLRSPNSPIPSQSSSSLGRTETCEQC